MGIFSAEGCVLFKKGDLLLWGKWLVGGQEMKLGDMVGGNCILWVALVEWEEVVGFIM